MHQREISRSALCLFWHTPYYYDVWPRHWQSCSLGVAGHCIPLFTLSHVRGAAGSHRATKQPRVVMPNHAKSCATETKAEAILRYLALHDTLQYLDFFSMQTFCASCDCGPAAMWLEYLAIDAAFISSFTLAT